MGILLDGSRREGSALLAIAYGTMITVNFDANTNESQDEFQWLEVRDLRPEDLGEVIGSDAHQ